MLSWWVVLVVVVCVTCVSVAGVSMWRIDGVSCVILHLICIVEAWFHPCFVYSCIHFVHCMHGTWHFVPCILMVVVLYTVDTSGILHSVLLRVLDYLLVLPLSKSLGSG